MKRCFRCGETKPVTDFSRAKNRADGLCHQCKACTRAYHEANKEKMAENKRAYNDANKEQITKRKRAYREANKEKIAEYRRAYDDANKMEIAEYMRAWQKANPESVRSALHRRRARKQGAEGSHTKEDIHQQYKTQRGKCYYCKCEVGDKYHVDHVVPLARGGSNGPENLVIACATCNTSKGAKLPHEWIQGGRLL